MLSKTQVNFLDDIGLENILSYMENKGVDVYQEIIRASSTEALIDAILDKGNIGDYSVEQIKQYLIKEVDNNYV